MAQRRGGSRADKVGKRREKRKNAARRAARQAKTGADSAKRAKSAHAKSDARRRPVRVEPRSWNDQVAIWLERGYRGDASAWQDLMVYIWPAVEDIARAELKGRENLNLALEDLVADVAGGFWASYGRSSQEGNDKTPEHAQLTSERVKPILSVIASNRLKAHFAWLERERKGHSEVEVDNVLRTSPSASQWARGVELRMALVALLDCELGITNRHIFELRIVHELSIQEIATRLKLKDTPEALRQRIKRIRKRLKGKLSAEMLAALPEPPGKTRKVAHSDKHG